MLAANPAIAPSVEDPFKSGSSIGADGRLDAFSFARLLETRREFQFIAGNMALDFVNTVGNRRANACEYLTEVAALTQWARLAGIISQTEHLALTLEQLAYVRSVREELYRRFLGVVSDDAPATDDVEWFATRLTRLPRKRHLISTGEEIRWEWQTSTDDPYIVLAPVFASAAELLTNNLYRKLRQCEGERCGWLFIDRSPPGHRRWCRMGDCGNRAKVRAFYRRNSAQGRARVADISR